MVGVCDARRGHPCEVAAAVETEIRSASPPVPEGPTPAVARTGSDKCRIRRFRAGWRHLPDTSPMASVRCCGRTAGRRCPPCYSLRCSRPWFPLLRGLRRALADLRQKARLPSVRGGARRLPPSAAQADEEAGGAGTERPPARGGRRHRPAAVVGSVALRTGFRTPVIPGEGTPRRPAGTAAGQAMSR